MTGTLMQEKFLTASYVIAKETRARLLASLLAISSENLRDNMIK